MDRNILLRAVKISCAVALRKESVDRNSPVLLPVSILIDVALRKESVDRNFLVFGVFLGCMSRSPQGERG